MTSDNPLIDPLIIDNVIQEFKNSNCDYMSTDFKKHPLGFAVEVFTFQSIERAWKEAKLSSEHEHVSPYFYKNPDKFLHSAELLKNKIQGISNKLEIQFLDIDKKVFLKNSPLDFFPPFDLNSHYNSLGYSEVAWQLKIDLENLGANVHQPKNKQSYLL